MIPYLIHTWLRTGQVLCRATRQPRLLWVRDCNENNVLTNVYISRKAVLDWKTHVLSQILYILCSCWECTKYALSACKLYIILWLTTIVYNIGFKVLFIYLFLLTEILFSLANSHQSIFWNCSFELYSFQFYIPVKPWANFFSALTYFTSLNFLKVFLGYWNEYSFNKVCFNLLLSIHETFLWMRSSSTLSVFTKCS